MTNAAEKSQLSVEINDDFLKSHGNTVFTGSKSGRELFEERLEKDLDLYNGKFSEDERKYSEYLGAARLFIPKTYTGTQRILIDVIDTFLPDPEEIVDIASWKSIPYETRQIVKALINYRLNGHPINFYHELYEIGLDALRNLIGVVKVYPKLKTKMVPRLIEFPLPTGETAIIEHPTEKDEVIDAYSPRYEALPPEDVFFSARATWKDYFKHPIVHRYEMTAAECLANGWKNVLPANDATDLNAGDPVKIARTEDIQDQGHFNTDIKAAGNKTVYEIWSFLPDETGEMRSGWFIMLGDSQAPSVVARGWEWNELPYKFDEFETNRPPFVVGSAFPEAHRLYGKSFPWITESLQKETNAVANQERESVARALRPTTYINKDANVDLMALARRRIGAYVQGDGPADQAVRELATMNPMAISPVHRERINQDYAEAGIPPNLYGASSNADSATESTQQLSNANRKIAAVLKSLAYTVILPSMQYLLRLEQTYADDAFIKKVTGRVLGWGLAGDALPATEYIQGDFDFKVNLGVNKQAQVSKLFLMMDRGTAANQALAQALRLGVMSPENAQFIDMMKPFVEAMKVLGFRDMDEWSIPAQAPAPMQAGGRTPGLASSPRQIADPAQADQALNPSAPAGALSVV